MIVVTGTDTGIGKTVFAAALTVALGAHYWKPVQAGLEDGSDAATVTALGVPAARVLPPSSWTTNCSSARHASSSAARQRAAFMLVWSSGPPSY